MASKRVSKRKSPCKDTIFLEVNDNDLSPEHHTNEDSEPEIKIMKTDTTLLEDEKLNHFNLNIEECDKDDESLSKINSKQIVLSFKESENASCEKDLTFADNSDETNRTGSNDLEDGEVIENINKDNTKSRLPSDSEIHISFGNTELADLYKFKFLKFLGSFVELEIIKETDLSITFQRDPLLNSAEWMVLDETYCSTEEKLNTPIVLNTPTKSKKKKAKKKKKDEDLFVLDTNPSQNEVTSHNTKYLSKFQIEIEQKEDENDLPVRNILVQTCFNCNENHSLKDCPLPKVHARINAARNKFKAQKLTTRYHLEEDQKYGHLTPGKISPALRAALGLRKNQLPPFIYRMRLIGYPPGWLEEAKFVHSNLDMFDAEGKTVKQKGNIEKQGLNNEKIIEYPGFNIPPEKYIKDEFKYYEVPPYSEKYSKSQMIKYFENLYATQQDNLETCNMDIDASENGKEEKTILENPQVKELKETTALGIPSPSLVELEKQKENLLLALQDNTSSNIISEENTCEEPEKVSSCKDDATESQDESFKLTSVDDCVDLDNSTDEGINDSDKSFANNTTIKTTSFGTPILKSKSPYSRLPNMDNFTKDVSPIINFENLPNSTGKYEQMTEVLQKVRNQMKNLQNCKS